MTPRNVNRIYQGELPVPRACMVILSIICGLDNAIGGQDIGEEPDLNQALVDARASKLQEFEIRHDHVFRRSETDKSLVKRFHPDRAKRDTTEEMQIINHFKSTSLRMDLRHAAYWRPSPWQAPQLCNAIEMNAPSKCKVISGYGITGPRPVWDLNTPG